MDGSPESQNGGQAQQSVMSEEEQRHKGNCQPRQQRQEAGVAPIGRPFMPRRCAKPRTGRQEQIAPVRVCEHGKERQPSDWLCCLLAGFATAATLQRLGGGCLDCRTPGMGGM
jgi:hypothetical protein